MVMNGKGWAGMLNSAFSAADTQHRNNWWYPLNACPKPDPSIPLLYPLENLTVDRNGYL